MKAAERLFIFTVGIICLLQISEGRKTYFLQNTNTQKPKHKLRAYDGSECAVDDGVNSFCIDHSVDINVGMEWTQAFTSLSSVNYYQIRYLVYGEVEIIFHPEIDLQGYWYGEMTADMNKFKASIFIELVSWWTYKFCFGAGNYIEDILFTWEMAMKFMDCYKTVVKALDDWESVYGEDSLWPFDDCDQSNDEDVTLYTWNPVVSDTTTYWYGDLTQTSAGCFLSIGVENPDLQTLMDLGKVYIETTMDKQ